MFFAAKEAVERRAFQRGQRAGIDQSINEGTDRGINLGIGRGRRQERARIAKLLAEHGVTISPELARDLAGCGCCDDTPGGNRAGGGQGAP